MGHIVCDAFQRMRPRFLAITLGLCCAVGLPACSTDDARSLATDPSASVAQSSRTAMPGVTLRQVAEAALAALPNAGEAGGISLGPIILIGGEPGTTREQIQRADQSIEISYNEDESVWILSCLSRNPARDTPRPAADFCASYPLPGVDLAEVASWRNEKWAQKLADPTGTAPDRRLINGYQYVVDVNLPPLNDPMEYIQISLADAGADVSCSDATRCG